MNLNIELRDDVGAAVQALAQKEGVSPERYVSRVLEDTLGIPTHDEPQSGPLEAGYGMWAKYGPAHPTRKLTKTAGT